MRSELSPKNEKKRNILPFLVVGIDIVLIFGAILLIHMRGIASMPPILALNAGIDIIVMIMGVIILICCYIDIERVGVDYRPFRLLIESTFLGLFTDIGACITSDQAGLWVWNLLDNTVFYMLMPVTVFLFWRYVMQLIGRKERWIKGVEIALLIGLLLEIVLCVVNVFAGFFFTVDHLGHYSRGPFFVLFMSYILLAEVAGIIIVVNKRKSFSGHQVVALWIYTVTPLLVIFVSAAFYGLSLNYTICMIDTLVMYGILNLEQGREKIEVEKELATAASIQEGVLPHTFPLFPDRHEFGLYASMDPAKDVGGDFYDAFLIDEDHLALAMGDVSGKGIPAALFMVITRTLIKSRAMMGGTPSEILTDVNRQLVEENEARLFVTVWLGILTISTGHLMETNAGHECPALRRENGGFSLLRTKHGVVCGAMKKANYKDDEIVLAPGETVFVYTDGVTEATNINREQFKTERMLDALNRLPDGTPEELLTEVRTRVDTFVGVAPQFDDLTMLAVKYYGPTGLNEA